MNTSIRKQNGSNFVESEQIYHSYNRTNNGEILFKSEIDHQAFLDTIVVFMKDYVDFIAHNLIPNHFHFMYKVKTTEQIVQHIKSLKFQDLCITDHKFLDSDKSLEYVDMLICNQFRRAFISYSDRVNQKYDRHGNLFHQNLNTVAVTSEFGQKITLRYINCNTVKHKMDIHPADYEWSSYNDYFDDGKKIVNQDLAMEYFMDIKEVEAFHTEYIKLHAAYLLKKKEVEEMEEKLFPEYLR